MTRKRGNNEGSIYQRRKDGRWVAAVSYFDRAGVRRRKTGYGATRDEAKDMLTDLLKAVKDAMPISSDKITVKQFLIDWLENTASPTLRKSSVAGYGSLIRNHIVPSIGRFKLSQLRPQDVEKMQNERLKAGASPRTVSYARAVLRVALNQAVAWELIARNPVLAVKAPSVKRYDVNPLTAEEVHVFLDGVRGDRLEALYIAAFSLGLRQGELLAIRWGDLDLTDGTLKVLRSLTRLKGDDRFGALKSDRSRRSLQLPGITKAALSAHRIRQVEDRLQAGSDWQDFGLVFTTRVGTPLDGNNVRRYFQNHLRRLGLRHQRFHDARHACASFLLAEGVSPRVVMEQLGHSQIALTMNTYSHVIPALQKEAAAKMDRLMAVR